MKIRTIRRFLYIEQDVNNALQVQAFASEIDAISYSKKRVKEAIKTLLGDEFVVPSEDVDEDGFFEHFGRSEEISSSEWGWYVYDGVCDTIRGYIEEITIDVESENSHGKY